MEISNYMFTMYLVYSFTIPFCDATMHTGIHNIIYTWLMNCCNWGSSLSLTYQGFFQTCNAIIPCQLCSCFLHINSKHDPQMTELYWYHWVHWLERRHCSLCMSSFFLLQILHCSQKNVRKSHSFTILAFLTQSKSKEKERVTILPYL